MGGDVDPWQEARSAWERLTAWGRQVAGRPDEGDRALTALADLGQVRRTLDSAEFEAVRSARRHGRSWSEIAVRLGVTRQSAWERWRDVDDDTPPTPARDVRRRSLVQVPDVVGLSWDEAEARLRTVGLVAVGADGSDPRLTAADWSGVVTDQSPEAGARVSAPGTPVRLWLERGGGSGVREPRRPGPDPKTGRKLRDEVTGEAVG